MSDTRDIPKDFVQENHAKETEELPVSCDNEQECSSKRNEKESTDKTNNCHKDSGSRIRKGKTKLKTQDKPSSGGAVQESPNKRKSNKTLNSDGHTSSGCANEKSRKLIQDFESTSSNEDGEITDKVDEHENMEQCKEADKMEAGGWGFKRLTNKMIEEYDETPIISNEEEEQSIIKSQQDKVKDNIIRQSSTNKGRNKEIVSLDENCNDKHEMCLNTEQEDTSDGEFFTQKRSRCDKPEKTQNIRNSDEGTQKRKQQREQKECSSKNLNSKEEKQQKIQEEDDIDGISEDVSLKNGETKDKTLEIQDTGSGSPKNRDETTQNDKNEKTGNRVQNTENERTVFQMENFILQYEEENCESRTKENQNTRNKKEDFNSSPSNIERNEKIAHSKDSTEQEKMSRRKWKRTRTQSIDESLAEEHQRKRPSESTSNGSQDSSIVSETVLKSQAFIEMLETTGCFSQRRRKAIEKSVTKVATWLVDHSEDSDEAPATVQRMNTEILTNTLPDDSTNDCSLIEPLNNNTKDDDSCDVFHEDDSRIYPIIDILPDRVLYYDDDPSNGSGSGGLIKESLLTSCRVVIPKLNLTQTVCQGRKSGIKANEPEDIPPAVTSVETNTPKKTEELGMTVLGAADFQDTNDEDCGYGSHGIIGTVLK